MHVFIFLRNELHMRQAARELANHDLHFHATNVFPQTLMRPKTEGQMFNRIVAANVKKVRVTELSGVMIAGVDDQQQTSASRDGHTLDHHITSGPTSP